MDDKIKKLLNSVRELGDKLRNESLKKRERLKLEREWKLKDQELMNYTRKLEMKMRESEMDRRTEEIKRLREEYKKIMKISYNSHPNIDHSWNPLRIQRTIEEVYKKAQEKELDKNNLMKESPMIKVKDEKFKRWLLRYRFKELAKITPDPKAVRTMLLAFKDWDEGKIDMEMLKKIFDECKNPKFNPDEFLKKYPIFKPKKK